jgi:hypothetical protein
VWICGRRIARLKGVTEMENLFAENIPDAKVSVEIQSFENVYLHFEKGPLNWRLYWKPKMFVAEKTKEDAYERAKREVSLPPIEEIPSVGIEQNEVT